jgi:hypothetical protein
VLGEKRRHLRGGLGDTALGVVFTHHSIFSLNPLNPRDVMDVGL